MASISDVFRECMYMPAFYQPDLSPSFCNGINWYFSLIQAVADVEREIMKALEKQYMEILMPLRDGIPEKIEKQVQRLTRRQSIAPYVVPNQVDTFARHYGA